MAGETLTRADIAGVIHQEVGLSRNESAEMIEAVVEEIITALKQDKLVKLSSFGRFSVRSKSKRLGRNPKTKQAAVITPRDVVSFHASNVLKARLAE